MKQCKRFAYQDYKDGDQVRLFYSKETFIVATFFKNERYIVSKRGKNFKLSEAHQCLIRSVKRENQMIAKRKSTNQRIIYISA